MMQAKTVVAGVAAYNLDDLKMDIDRIERKAKAVEVLTNLAEKYFATLRRVSKANSSWTRK